MLISILRFVRGSGSNTYSSFVLIILLFYCIQFVLLYYILCKIVYIIGNWLAQGQVCSNGTRVYVHKDVMDPFLKQLISRTAAMKIGEFLVYTRKPLISLRLFICSREIGSVFIIYNGEECLYNLYWYEICMSMYEYIFCCQIQNHTV